MCKVLRLHVGLSNLGFLYIFSESPGSIEYCYVFGFPITWGSWPDRASAAPCQGKTLPKAAKNKFDLPNLWPQFQALPMREEEKEIRGMRPAGEDNAYLIWITLGVEE